MRLDRSRARPLWLVWVWRGLAFAPTFAALLCTPAQARGIDDAGADLARRLLSEGKILPLEDIIRRARSLRDGSLIDAELSFEDDHATHV
ncbi:MAG: hypothetical protein WBM40_21645 [Thiohalocapsa sp.]